VCAGYGLTKLGTVFEARDIRVYTERMKVGIAESLCFIDGNKRLALVAMLAFLEVNGYAVEATDPELATWIISLRERLRLAD
jgi:prophage maintenance system killer protein